jgi:NAD kinase
MNKANSQSVTRLALAIHPHYHRAEEALSLIDGAAKRHGIEVLKFDGGNALPSNPSCQAVVSVGGDGTLLAAVHRAHPSDIPVWGINVGHLGFLTTSGLEEIESGMAALSKGEYLVERRSMIEADAYMPPEQQVHMVALNDIVIHRDITKGQLTIQAELDGRFLASYDGDGLIVATPTGSRMRFRQAGRYSRPHWRHCFSHRSARRR